MTIAIVMATYNGGAWLTAQLDSLFAQTEQDWQLYVRDDSSPDDTLDIIRTYHARYPGRIEFLENTQPRANAKTNFSALFLHVDACSPDIEYLMCCDQDDVWRTDKIAVSLHAMRELEARYGEMSPLLVHTDATITDEALRATYASFADFQSLASDFSPFNRLLVQNTVLGCTMMINRTLLHRAGRCRPRRACTICGRL